LLALGFDWRRAGGQDAADQRFFRFDAGFGQLRQGGGNDRGQAFVARLGIAADFRGTNTLDFKMRCFKFVVGDDDDRHFVPRFDFGHAAAFFVEQEIRDRGWHLYQYLAGAFLHGMFFDQAQYR
jgi:hypothetical protein